MTTPAISEAVARAKELLAQPQKELDFSAEHVAAAVAQLSELLPKQPTVPSFWLTLADAQMMQGKLSDGRDSLARCLSLLYPHGFAVQTEFGLQQRPRSVATTGAPDPFSVLSAPYSRTAFDRVLASYRALAARSMLDRRLRFYIFNMLKAADDLAGAYEWLDCKDLDDAFLATYVREYGRRDYFDYKVRAWFQTRFFKRVAASAPLETKFEVLYFTCLLNDAAENEEDANKAMESEPVEYEDDAPDVWTDEDAILFEVNKETQAWRVFRAMLLRIHGKLESAQAEFELAIASDHVVTVTMAAKLGLAHIKLEQLQPQEAFDIYEQLRHDIKAASGSLLISDSEPVYFCPAAIESDACFGAAQSLRHLGNADAHEMFGLALQADSMCGDALWQSVLCDCKRNSLSAAKASLERLLKEGRPDDAEVPQLHSIMAAGPRLRTTEMALDHLRPSPAAIERGKLVKSNEGKWRGVLQILGSGDTDAVWFHLFAFIGQKRAADAIEAVSILMAANAALPAVLDVTTFMQKQKIRKGDADMGQRALLADFHVSLGNWFEKKLGLSDEAFAEYALALEMLDEKIMSHRKVLWKLLWKRHKIFLRRERTDAAIFNLQECIRIIANDYDPFALTSNQKQQDVNAKYAKYNFFLSTLFFGLQQIDMCSPLFEEAVKSEKYHAAALGYQGLCLAQCGPAKHSSAMRMLRESLVHGSDTLQETHTIRFQLAALLAHPGPFQNLSGSIEEYSKILRIEPGDTAALSMRGGVYFMAEQTELAIADFSQCIQLLNAQHCDDDRLRHAMYSRARALQRLGKYHEAIKDFKSLQAAGMQTMELMGNCASAYEAIGDFDKALSMYEKMITITDKSEEEKYQTVLRRRAALCSVCNQHELGLRDLNALIQLDPEDVKARHQRGSMLLAKYSGTDISGSKDASREAVSFLRTALEDFQLVLKLQPNHVQARLRRKEVCNVLNETLPDDDAFDEDMKQVEAEELHGIEPDLVIDYALKMAADVQTGQKGSGQRSFPLLRLRGGKKNAQNLALWEEISFTIHSDGRCEVKNDIFYLVSSTCVRENFNNGLFSFRMCFTAYYKAGVFTFATSKSQVRDDIFRHWHRFKDPNVEPKEKFATPIRLLEKLFSLDSTFVQPLFHVAKLREYQQQYSTAKAMYLAVLAGLVPSSSAQETRQGKENSENKLAPPASRHVKGITEAMCKPVPGNTVINQMKAEVFYRLGIMILEDPSIADSERARLEIAVWYLRVSVKIDGSQKDSHFKLGMLLLRAEEFEEAATCFRAVTRIAPKSVESWNNLGVALDRVGEPDESMRAFREATALKPDFQSAICNLCIITLRNEIRTTPDPVQLSTAIRQLTEVIDSGDDAHPSRAFAYGLRGLAYQLRNSTKRGIRDADLAVEDYLTAVDMDPRNLQGRVGIVCIYLDRQDLGAAYPHLEWLVTSHSRSDIVGELLVWSRKIRLVFEDPISMFLQCLHMNPSFWSLSLTGTNVCIAPLQNKQELMDTIQFESMRQSDTNPRTHRKEGLCMSVYHYTQMASLSLDEGNMRRCLALMTSVLVLLPAKSNAIIRAHVFRSLAFEKHGQIDLAAIDAAAALHHLGHRSALCALEGSSGKGADEKMLGELIQEEGFEANQPLPVHLAQSPDLQSNCKSKLQPHNVPCPEISIEFKYSLLCYAGALLQHSADEACKCYALAQELLPERLEAHLNLANLRRLRMQYLGSLDAYVEAAKAMLKEEEEAVDSKFLPLQHRLVDLLVVYRTQLGLLLDKDKASGADVNINHLQGEMLLLGREFATVYHDSFPQSPFVAARRNLLQEAAGFEKILMDADSSFHKDPHEAFRLYAPYQSALEDAFAALAHDFPAEAEAAATEISEADRAMNKQHASDSLHKASKSARIMSKLSTVMFTDPASVPEYPGTKKRGT